MNIAFPALLIFLVALPGILIRYTYKKGPNGGWKNPFIIQSLGDEIAWSLGLAAILHYVWIALLHHFGVAVDLNSALALLVGGKDDRVTAAVKATAESANGVVLYFLGLSALAYVLGLIGHGVVRKYGLDHRYRFLRFDNPWFYLLSGEYTFGWQSRPKWWPFRKVKIADVVKVSGAVAQGDQVFLYVGRLVDYEFDRSGQLDRLILKEASRRPLHKDRGVHEAWGSQKLGSLRFYPIQSSYFLLRYEDICTLNVEYKRLITS